ncbi:MAG: hypothetical protein LBD37_08105 [Treponema sp.]|nr:hypothetical protein [Treponema sp.]
MEISTVAKQLEEIEAAKGSLKFRLTLFFVFFFVSIFGVFIITSVIQVSVITRYVASQLSLPALVRAMNLIDGDAFEALAQSLDAESPYYTQTRERLYALKKEANVRHLYTMAPVDQYTYRFIIDGGDESHGEDFSPLGALEDVSTYEDAFFAAASAKEPQLGKVDASQRWGILISTYGPIINSSGEVVGIVGCDLEGDNIARFIKYQVFWQLGAVVLFTLAGLGVYLSLVRKINQVMRGKTT